MYHQLDREDKIDQYQLSLAAAADNFVVVLVMPKHSSKARRLQLKKQNFVSYDNCTYH